jgi:hypothetical protein
MSFYSLCIGRCRRCDMAGSLILFEDMMCNGRIFVEFRRDNMYRALSIEHWALSLGCRVSTGIMYLNWMILNYCRKNQDSLRKLPKWHKKPSYNGLQNRRSIGSQFPISASSSAMSERSGKLCFRNYLVMAEYPTVPSPRIFWCQRRFWPP